MSGYKAKVLPSTLKGGTRTITLEEYTKWRADCGFPETTIETEPLMVDLSPDLPKGDAVVRLKTDDIADLDNWTDSELETARIRWMQPDNPSGPITNGPYKGSGTWPSPETYAKILRANDILLKRRAANQPRILARQTRFQNLRGY